MIPKRDLQVAARVAAKLTGESVLTRRQLDVAAEHYIIAAIWADCEEGTSPRPTHKARLHARKAVEQFSKLIGQKVQQAILDAEDHGYGNHTDCGDTERACAAMGHDIWLTRQGHGVGFRDRDELTPTIRNACYEACKQMKEAQHHQYRGWMEISD